MVDVNPAEWDAMRKGKVKLEEMNEFDRMICGADSAKHLIIPMDSVYNLRRIADIIRSLCADLDMLSRRTDYTARTAILETRALIDDTNARIRELSGKGKRKKITD